MQIKKQLQPGITLIEVLAAIFVVSIGLLGVLAVIPFGAFQVSKAQHAEYASNMLANAAEEILIREMAKPEGWGLDNISSGVPASLVFEKNSPPEDSTLNCTKFIWIEPREMFDPPNHIFCIGATFRSAKEISEDIQVSNLKDWAEWMRGQDDLVYTTYGDKRPDFTGQGGKIQSSGKYTWFFTYLPKVTGSSVNLEEVPLDNLDKVDVDILACYNRVPSDDKQIQCEFTASLRGGTFTPGNTDADIVELLSQTKYVFVTWELNELVAGGSWCKIVFVDKSDPQKPKIIVTGALPDSADNIYIYFVYIPSGVLYHKQLEGVPIR